MFTQALLGGTFDHLHKGHTHFISEAMQKSQHVTIGISTVSMYQEKPLAETIQSYEEREQGVRKYLEKNHWQDKTTIIPITDMYGNSLEEEGLEALFVVPSGAGNAGRINAERRKKGFPEMQIIVVDEIEAEDGEPISSRRIRKGEIDRDGNVYKNLFLKTLHMPETLRKTLQESFGQIVTDVHKIPKENMLLVTVGDIVTYSFRKEYIYPAISIIDFRSKRASLTDSKMLALLPASGKRISNPPGMITAGAVSAYQKALDTFLADSEKNIIAIDGEEDLLALPAILLAPLGSIVMYGIQRVGMIAVSVDEAKKKQIKELVTSFSS